MTAMTQIAPSPAETVRTRYRDAQVPEPAVWNATLAVLHEHRSVRRYLPDPVSDDTLRLLISAAQSAPTSSNLQVWSVVAVRDPDRKARLAALAGDQAHVVQAPLLLVWTADFARLRQLAADHDAPLAGADYLESSYVGFIDAALAAQNAVVAAESLGLGTVYIGALRNHPEAVATELQLPPGVFATFGLVVGHPDPSERAQVKPRLPQQAVLHRETYRLPEQRSHLATYERRIAEFYGEQDLGHSWTERVLARLASARSLAGRDRLRTALHNQGFPLR
ncbi:NADPH-dependent oxidoreductase [Nocardia farcinica]|nr:NADPH-dependent oxidoreductase [Nocardia farcinica]MBF6290319.1 NADPH-dependent oxidoreductase [Nocardia farcinica]MBF6371908.1 NADPH-dependent oxidoreductase [Nocardia farcinica]MBF6377492.1 NADPH-dependent oxidoreductase [Nocardia farcinica]MBF6573105.1 NADPH-dependent oxidoreductase [Nocardia farcinica]